MVLCKGLNSLFRKNIFVQSAYVNISFKIKKKKTHPPKRDTFFDEVEILLTQQMGRKIKVNGTREKGTIEIAFYNRDELKRLAELLSHEND